MSESKPVVVYGASGYTGRLVCEYLREYNVPFIAAGRAAARVQEVMDRNVPGIETADYEVVEVEHTVDALTELFSGAKVVCNTVGPFATLGGEVVEACLSSGCHYVDTTGEQNWMMDCDEHWGERFAERGLLLSPGIAQMYTTGEIAANICLETPGLDTLDILVLWKGFPTYASTQTIFTNLLSQPHYLQQQRYVPVQTKGTEVSVPGQHETALTLPWGGTSHPVWFKRDPRVANVKVLGGVFDRAIMEGVIQVASAAIEAVADLPPGEQQKALSEQAAQMQSGMPPRENQRINISLDSVYASGPLGLVHCVLRGACNYKQTGLLQAYAAYSLLHGVSRRVGFASACQAFGHRELLGVLQSFGLTSSPVVTGTVSPVALQQAQTAIPSLNGSGRALAAH
jgi:hypothetical protein